MAWILIHISCVSENKLTIIFSEQTDTKEIIDASTDERKRKTLNHLFTFKCWLTEH